MPKPKKHRRRLLRAERDALAPIATPEINDYVTPTELHRFLLRRALVRQYDVRLTETIEKAGTPMERRTTRKTVLFVLTLRGLQAALQLRANGERGFDRVPPFPIGDSWPANLRPACASCNLSKHTRTWECGQKTSKL